MKLAVAALLSAGVALGASLVELPPRGMASTEEIRRCETQVAGLRGIQKTEDDNGTGYWQMNPGSDSYVYFFTGPAEAAHPSLIAVTLHPMRDPLRPRRDEVEFHESYASSEEHFVAWRKRVLVEFGRGFAIGAYEAAKKQPSGDAQ